MFSTLSKTEIMILKTFNSSSANAFNLDQSGILSFGKELNTISLQIQAVPTVIAIRNKTTTDKFTGMQDDDVLETFLEKLIG